MQCVLQKSKFHWKISINGLDFIVLLILNSQPLILSLPPEISDSLLFALVFHVDFFLQVLFIKFPFVCFFFSLFSFFLSFLCISLSQVLHVHPV